MKCDCGRKLKKKDKFCPNCSKKVEEIVNTTENKKNGKNMLMIIVIILLSMIIILLSVILITTSDIFYKKDMGLNVIGTTWLNYSVDAYSRLEEKIEFNKDETFKYTTVRYTDGEMDLNNTMEGTYKVFDDVIIIYYPNDPNGESISEYSLHVYGDYLCFSWRCEEIDRFYLSTDDRASEVKDIEAYNKKKIEYFNNELEYVNAKKPTIYIFYSEHCTYSTQLFEWLENYDYKNGYNIVKYDTSNSENSDLFRKVLKCLNTSSNGTPFTIIGSELIEGFDTDEIEKAIHKAYTDIENNKYYDIIKTVKKLININDV